MKTLEQNKADLEAYGYRLVTWAEFEAATDRPEGLMERARQYLLTHGGSDPHIVYDPDGDADGWMLIGDGPIEIAQVTCDFIRDGDPPEGPLMATEKET